MALFEQLEYLPISPSRIPEIVSHLQSVYAKDGQVLVKYGETGGCVVEIINSSSFGFQIIVDVYITPHADGHMKVHVCNPNMFGNIFCGILLLFLPMRWYQIIPYFSTLCGQASLDNKVIAEIKAYLNIEQTSVPDYQVQKQFCVYCGAENLASAAVCRTCGQQLGETPAPAPDPRPTPAPSPKPSPVPDPQPTPSPVPKPSPSPKRLGKIPVMEIDSTVVFGNSVLLSGICQSEVAVGDMVKVESLDGNLAVVDQVYSIQSYNINVPKSKPGSKTVLELKGYDSLMIKDGTVYLK